jgi:hypothetical protein
MARAQTTEQPACEQCRYWIGRPIGGECRRHAPSVLAHRTERWPQTRADEWCGDYSRKPETTP